jgi:hypothetical protein
MRKNRYIVRGYPSVHGYWRYGIWRKGEWYRSMGALTWERAVSIAAAWERAEC